MGRGGILNGTIVIYCLITCAYRNYCVCFTMFYIVLQYKTYDNGDYICCDIEKLTDK